MANISQTESVFNPGIPKEQAPDWWKDSRAISQPETPKAGGFAFSGLAALTGEAIHGLDTAQKIGLDEEVRSGIDKIRNDQIAKMYEARDTLGGMVAAGKPIPKDLQNLSENLSALDNARANGKISLTDYDGRLNQFLSETRGRNPGYRDYIDEVVHKTLGYEPANQQIRQLAQDINAMTASKKSETDWMVKEVVDKYSAHSAQVMPGGPAIGADAMAAGLKSGQFSMTDYVHWKMPYDALKMAHDQHKFAEPLDEKNARDMANGLAFGRFNADMNGLMVMTGHGAFKIQENLQRAAAGEFAADPETWKQAGAGLESLLAASRQNLAAEYRKRFQSADGSSTSINAVLKDGELEKILDFHEKPWKDIIALIKDQQFSPAYAKMRLISDIQTGVTASLLSQEHIGPILANLDELQKRLPPEMFKEVVDGIHDKPAVNKAIVDWGFSKQLESLTGKPNTPSPTKLPSIKDTIEEGKSKGIVSGDVYKSVFNNVAAITNSKLPKENFNAVVDYFFKPGNRDLLSLLNRDYTDASGNRIQGKYAAFDILTQPKVTAAIAGRGTSDQKTNYYNTVSGFLSDLWRTDVRDLSNIQGLHWNNTTHQYIMPPRPGVNPSMPRGFSATGQVDIDAWNQNNRRVNDINQALEQYALVVEATKGSKDPSQVDTEILNTLDQLKVGAEGSFIESLKGLITSPWQKMQEETPSSGGYAKQKQKPK